MASTPITLLLTNSFDNVSDLIVRELGTEHIFRYNSDLWPDYKLRVTQDTFELENAAGRRITDDDVVKVYRRSCARASEIHPDHPLSAEKRYMEEELWSAWSDLLDRFWADGKVVLVNPSALWRIGKMQQLRVARKHFVTTPYSFLINRPDALRPGVESVAKSFSFHFGNNGGFYARPVREDQLDPACPWFLTNLVKARWDVTVAVVRDDLFAFSLDRSAFINQTIDWRLAPEDYARGNWQPLALPPAMDDAVFAFLRGFGAHYARLDFLRSGDTYTFLEANFTGEWGWLDPEGRFGLRDKILHEIDPRTPRVSCPRFEWSRFERE